MHIWHVGARGGYTPYDFPAGLDALFSITFFDEVGAAPSETYIGVEGRPAKVKTRFLPSIVWSDPGIKMFQRTQCPYASGLKPFNKHYSNWYVFGNPDADYILGSANHLIELKSVNVTTLDSVSLSQNWPGPSILVTDAQGASVEILAGAAHHLESDVDIIIAEVEFLPFFDSTPSFATLVPLLLKHDLLFAKFMPETNPWASPLRVPLGCRSAPFMGSADAVFIRDPQVILSSGVMERRLRYIISCLCLGFVDIASYVMLQSSGWQKAVSDLAAEALELLTQFDVALREMPDTYPRAFGENNSPLRPSEIAFLSGVTTPLEDFLNRWSFTDAAMDIRARRKKHMLILSKEE